MKIKSNEKFYTSYLLELRDGSLIVILAKELVNGRLDFVMFAYCGDEERALMKVKDIEKEQYDEVVLGLIKSLHFDGLLGDVRAIYPKEL